MNIPNKGVFYFYIDRKFLVNWNNYTKVATILQ